MEFDLERWTRVDRIFAEALETPPEARKAHIEAATRNDPDLLREVMALVDSHPGAADRIGESAVDLLPADGLGPETPPGLSPGDEVGPYRIIRKLGQGGMGDVFLAERADQSFQREVAIKVVRPNLAADHSARRFHAERRILARLEHPNIARLYDSAITADGRPCLVMEYVAGTRIDHHADERRLDLRARLNLFLAACDGVSYAHQQLIVHRDLKPANVRVTAAGEVKLLDFGIAKLLSADDPAEPATRAGTRLLTPEYAPPEQVRGDPATARMDVYALGVILHELLVGARPAWQGRVLDLAEPADIERAMVPPSLVAARSTEIAEERGTDPDGLRRALRGDLDSIVLTALAPDPGRRYPSVEALRTDVARHLAGLPISVRPASVGYRLGKFVRRNRALVGSGVVVAVLATSYLATVQLQSRRIAVERDRAEQERTRADEVIRVLTDLFGASDPFAPGRPDTLRVGSFLAGAAERVQRELADQPAVLAKVLGVLGTVQRQLGRYDEAAPLLERALVLQRERLEAPATDLAASLADLGLLRRVTAQLPQADSLLRQALELVANSNGDPSQAAKIQGYLGVVLLERGLFDSAAAMFDSVLVGVRARVPVDSGHLAELLGNRGTAAQRRGNRAGAVPFFEEAHAIKAATLGADHPSTLLDLGNLGFLRDRMGAPAEAVPMLEAAVGGLERRLGGSHPTVLAMRRNLGGALSRAGRLPEAITALEGVVAADRARLGGRHFDLGISLDYLAGVYDQAQRFPEAERAFRENYEVFRDLVGPGHFNTALALGRYAWARCRPGVPFEAGARAVVMADFERALAVIDTIMPPANNQRIGRHVMHGTCLSRAGRHQEGEAELIRQLELARGAFPAGDPTLRFAVGELGGHYARTGNGPRQAWIAAVADSLGVARRP